MSEPSKYRQVTEAMGHAILLAGILFALWTNWQSLYTYPVPNSWIYWSGDETQAMSESMAQVQTGIYSYPLAVGSIFSEGSGILKGSVWISSLVYGVPALIADANPVDVGRTVSFILGIMLLAMMYGIIRGYRVNRGIALGAVLLLVSSPCFLIMSHSARYDIFVGLTCLWILSVLIGNEKQKLSGTIIGLIVLVGLLVSAHVWIDCFLAIIFILWYRGVLKTWRTIIGVIGINLIGIAVLSAVYFWKSGRFDFLGPFDHVPLPIYRFFSPGAQRGNLLYRWFIVEQWSPMYIWLGISLLIGIAYLLTKNKSLDRTLALWIGSTALMLFSITYFEAIVPRYYIYVLPELTVLFAIAAKQVWCMVGNWNARLVIALASIALLGAQLFQYTASAQRESGYAAALARSNDSALSRVKTILESDSSQSKRVITSTPGLYALGTWNNSKPIVPLFLYAPSAAWTANNNPLWLRADYVLTYNSARVPHSNEDDGMFQPLLGTHMEKVLDTAGCFTDIGRSYSEDGMRGLDTLRLYRIVR